MTNSCIRIGLEAGGTEEVLDILAREAEASGLVSDHRLFFEQLKLREAEMSTGVGLGLAVPHAEVAGASRTFVIGATLTRPIEYKSIDDQPVDIVFLIGGRPGEVGLHLQLLARIARLARQPEFLAKLRSQKTAEGFMSAAAHFFNF
jgi:PTS system nitrogen regulatory IIA component